MWSALDRCVPRHSQVVESHKPSQPPAAKQSREELSEMPVRDLKTMLQSRNISFIGGAAPFPLRGAFRLESLCLQIAGVSNFLETFKFLLRTRAETSKN